LYEARSRADPADYNT